VAASNSYPVFDRVAWKNAKNPKAITFAGRALVKVSLENGPIAVGDKITISKYPGVGMKATSSGYTLGTALRAFDESDPATSTVSILGKEFRIAKIEVSLNLGYSTLSSQISAGEINPGNFIDPVNGVITPTLNALNMNGEDVVNVKNILSQSGKWSIDESGRLKVEEVHAQKLCLGDTCITESELKDLLQLRSVPAAPSGSGNSAPTSAGGVATPTVPTDSPPPSPPPSGTTTPLVVESPSTPPASTDVPAAATPPIPTPSEPTPVP